MVDPHSKLLGASAAMLLGLPGWLPSSWAVNRGDPDVRTSLHMIEQAISQARPTPASRAPGTFPGFSACDL